MHAYIDGESHFIRSEQCIRDVFGEETTLEALASMLSGGPKVFIDRRCKFFWISAYDYSISVSTKKKLVYFTTCSGDDDVLHQVRTSLRATGFEPQVMKEVASLAKQRSNTLSSDALIEKAKGVDIALTVRFLEDAQKGVFDECCLFTSDVDYIPVIQAVQRMGKTVAVYGYRNGIARNSPMEYVPDVFYDLANDIQLLKQHMLAKRLIK